MINISSGWWQGDLLPGHQLASSTPEPRLEPSRLYKTVCETQPDTELSGFRHLFRTWPVPAEAPEGAGGQLSGGRGQGGHLLSTRRQYRQEFAAQESSSTVHLNDG